MILHALVAAASLAAACAPPAGDAAFGYDRTTPLQLKFGSASSTATTRERDLTFAAGGRIVTATLIGPNVPSRPLHGAGILWVHWLGNPGTTNRTEFAADARVLAARGATSLLVDAVWAQPHWFDAVRRPATDPCEIAREVGVLRRALDVLGAQGVDPARIAYVGHDFGAMVGSLLLAVDPRPAYAVLMTPTLSFWEWLLLAKPPADLGTYVATMSRFDLPPYLARSRARATLLQFAEHDTYVSAATATVIANAVPAHGRTFVTYASDHTLRDPAATRDREIWLIGKLAAGATKGD